MLNKNQLIPINEIKEKFEAISLDNDSIVHCEINLNDGTIKNMQRLDISFDEIALNTVNNELCISEKNTRGDVITFQRIDLKTFSQKHAITLNLNNYFSPDELMEESHYSRLIYLNHQYLLYFITKSEIKYGQPFYQYIILVNTATGETKIINPVLPNGDNLLRLDIFKNIYLSNDNHFLLLKTGRIQAFEKQSMYTNVDLNNPYYDHLESIYIIEISSLINHQNFDSANPIALLNYSSSLEKLRYEKNILSYVLSDFSNNNQELIKHDLLVGNISKFQDDQSIQGHLNYEFEIEPNYYHFILSLFKQEKSETFILIDDELVFDLKLDKIS